jgi:hypothetical protein
MLFCSAISNKLMMQCKFLLLALMVGFMLYIYTHFYFIRSYSMLYWRAFETHMISLASSSSLLWLNDASIATLFSKLAGTVGLSNTPEDAGARLGEKWQNGGRKVFEMTSTCCIHSAHHKRLHSQRG